MLINRNDLIKGLSELFIFPDPSAVCLVNDDRMPDWRQGTYYTLVNNTLVFVDTNIIYVAYFKKYSMIRIFMYICYPSLSKKWIWWR